MQGPMISQLVNEHFAGTDKFLVEVLVKPVNRVFIFIDGDHGVTIDDCVTLSRFIESRLDRETVDFELNVSSAGADQPIRLPRQYPKNIGRTLRLKLEDERELTGTLMATSEDSITLLTAPDKKKKLPSSELTLAFEEIKEAKVIISFK